MSFMVKDCGQYLNRCFQYLNRCFQFANQAYGQAYYNQMGYWGYPQGGYQQMQPGGYGMPYMQHGYGYGGYG